MDEKTLKRAASGDPEAIRQLRGSVSDEEARRLAEIFQKSETENEQDSKERFWSDLRELKDAIASKPALTARRLEEMEDRARSFGTCEMVQVLGLKSYRHRLLGDLGAAEDVLEEAWSLAPLCRSAEHSGLKNLGLNPCFLELHRRRGVLEAALRRPESGLAHVELALGGYRRLGGPGHNINSDGIASTLYARGEIRYELQDYAGCVADFSSCLDRFPVTSEAWSRAHQNLATVLAQTGREGRERAHRMLGRLRLVMRSRGETVERASFLWTDGQLTAYLRKRRGMKKLRDSLDCFAGLGMPHHYIGVAADVCRVLFPHGDNIREFLDEIKPTALALVRDPRHRELFNDLYDLVRLCPTPSTSTRLDDVLMRLRETVTAEASLPPCLLVSA